MSTKTGIEWTETTWNPIAGCAVVSPGCKNCYAMGEAHRLGERIGQAKYKGLTRVVNGKPVWTGEVRVWEKALLDPLKWRKPRRVFVNSMSDLFADGASDETIDRIFAVMALAPQHTFQILTKRPERMKAYLRLIDRWLLVERQAEHLGFNQRESDALDFFAHKHFLQNVWLGVSVEDQRRADERIPLLLDTPAAVRWISAEPLLGPVILTKWHAFHRKDAPTWQPTIDWVVVGGESGPDARPMHPDWARSLRDQCEAAGVAFFFKQWGESWPAEKTKIGPTGEVWRTSADGKDAWFFDEIGTVDPPQLRFSRVGKKRAGRTLDGRTHDAYPQVKA